MKQSISLFVTLLLAVSLFAGCADSTPAQENPPAAPASTVQEEAAPPEQSDSDTGETQEVAEPENTSPTKEVKQLAAGTVEVYRFGALTLHAYLTGDALNDQVFLLETDTGLVAIESPSFTDNMAAYVEYIGEIGKPLEHVIIPNHPSGASLGLYADVPIYATGTARAAMQDGGSIKGLVDGFTDTFGDYFLSDIPEITEIIQPGTVEIGGIEMIVTENGDTFDIEIPAINCVYTHMMGSDVHNILSSVGHIDAMIAQMQSYQAKGHNLILTGHYAPEGIDMVAVKLAYLEKAKELAQGCESAEGFIEQMNQAFPGYSGDNYLEMSAGLLFTE